MSTAKQNAKQTTFDAWKKMMDEQFARIENAYGEIARYEKQAVDQANAAIDEVTRLMKDSLDYTVQLSNEWRKATHEAVQKTGEMVNAMLSH